MAATTGCASGTWRRKPVSSIAVAHERQRSGSHRKGITVSHSGRKRSTLELGHDSFLDIVANLVGILIILVVVLGTQSAAVIEQVNDRIEDENVAETEDSFATDQQLAAFAKQSMRAAAAQDDSNRFEKLVKQYDAKINVRKQERDYLMDLMAEAEAAWETKKKELDQETTRMAKRQTEFQTAQEELEK